jgi:hypothetical protein
MKKVYCKNCRNFKKRIYCSASYNYVESFVYGKNVICDNYRRKW